jgi:hypothetical protein
LILIKEKKVAFRHGVQTPIGLLTPCHLDDEQFRPQTALDEIVEHVAPSLSATPPKLFIASSIF